MEVNNNSNKMQEELRQEKREMEPACVSVNGFFYNTKPEEVEVEEEQSFMFDPELVQNLDSARELRDKNPALKIRPLSSTDFERGFLELLRQLTSVGTVTKADFIKRFYAMKTCSGTYYTTVIHDEDKNQIVGAATLIIERKFIHECAMRGIIEEVIVSDEYRGKQLGKLLVATVVDLAKRLECYKITLNCRDEMIRFYERLGFVAEQGNANFLIIRVPQTEEKS